MITSRNIGIFVLVVLFLFFSSIFTIQEGHQGLLLRLGKFVNDGNGNPLVLKPGLHFKWPLIDSAKIFDTRLQTLSVDSSRMMTSEKKDVIVDYYVKWQINHLPIFYTHTGGSEYNANVLLQQKLNDNLREQIGQRTIKQIISDQHSQILSALTQQADKSAQSLGIQIIDVRLKSIELPPSVSESVYQRMRSEQERIATQNRSLGKADAEIIKAKADAQVTITLATANEQAAQIRAAGQAQAAAIYADAYNKDPQFFTFYRSIMAFKEAFDNKKDFLVLSPRSEFFKYFESPNGKAPNVKP